MATWLTPTGSTPPGSSSSVLPTGASSSSLLQGRPEILAQVHWAVEHEFATHLEDFFVRRTQRYYRDANHGLGALAPVTSSMAKLLNWSSAECVAQRAEYRDFVTLHQQWKKATVVVDG
ncbi:MAG: hypothetical protein H6714_00645 [Myxococcales bacterium]|nr:hypothetical protein [Myxococcales bacterium]